MQEIELRHPAARVPHQADAAAAQARRHRIGRGQREEHGGHRVHGAAAGCQRRRARPGGQRLVGDGDAGAHGLAFLAGGVGLGRIVPQPHRRRGVIAQAGDGLAPAQEQKRRGKKGKSAWRTHETVLILKIRWRRLLCPTGGRSPDMARFDLVRATP